MAQPLMERINSPPRAVSPRRTSLAVVDALSPALRDDEDDGSDGGAQVLRRPTIKIKSMRRKSATTMVDSLSVLCCTANLGNADPQSNNENGICSWLPRAGGGYDVIAVGIQEGDYHPNRSSQAVDLENADFNDDGTSEAKVPRKSKMTNKRKTVVTHAFAHSDDESDQDGDGEDIVEKKKRTHKLKTKQPKLPTEAKKEKVLPTLPTKGRKHLKAIIDRALGPGYVLVAEATASQMRLRVYVKEKHKVGISNVQKATENTGLVHVMANKGGQVVAFSLYDISFCFISSHLAAHDKEKYLERRNGDYEEICRNIRIWNRSLGLTSQFHHAFWVGDLNYRLNVRKNTEWEGGFEDRWDRVEAMINDGQLDELYELDELQQQIKLGRAFTGWTTPQPPFPPTYKVERDEPYMFHGKRNRIPSWTDRVLYRSLPGFESDLSMLSYESCPNFMSSDHKPVMCSFKISNPLRNVDVINPNTIKPGQMYYFLQFSSVQLTLSAEKHTRSLDRPDPYFAVYSDPPGLLVDLRAQTLKECARVPVSRQYTNRFQVTFKQALNMKALVSTSLGPDQFKNCHAMIAVMDHQTTVKDRHLGSMAIGLGELWRDCQSAPDNQFLVEKQLFLHGNKAGRIRFMAVFEEREADDEMSRSFGCCQS